MKPVMSIERRLQLGIGLSIAGFTLLFILLGGYAVHRLSVDYVLSRLEHDAESLLSATRPAGRGFGRGMGMGMGLGPGNGPGAHDHQVRPNRITPVYLQPYSGHYYLVRVGDGDVEASRSLWDFSLPLPQVGVGERDIRQLPGPENQLLLQLTVGYRRQGTPLVISVAEDIANLELRIARYQWGFGAAAIVLLGLLLLLLRFLVKQGFVPLERLRREVRGVANGERGQLREDVPSEVRPLVEELNRLLGLLGSRLTRSRHALGNLAHALKTPLNLIAQELEAANLDDAGRQRLEQRLERIRQLTQRELRRARLAGGGSPGQHFSPAQEIPDLLHALQSMYRDKSLTFDTGRLPDTPMLLDREDMLELLGNLLDNACKWTAGRVRLRIERQVDGFIVQVSDDGPGVDPTQMQGLAERGVRIDEQLDGHGLGLAIVQDMVNLYGGRLQFGRDPQLGGLQVTVHLPDPTRS